MTLAWDRALFARAAAVGSVAALLTLVVIAATDEGGPWAVRLGMWAALAPVAGSLGALATARLAVSRGEVRALESLGAHPLRVVLGAASGGAAVGALGPLLAASGWVHLDALFPRPVEAHAWVAEGPFLRDLARGVAIDASGALLLGTPARAALDALPSGAGRATVALLVGLAAAAPLWASAPGRPLRKAGVGAALLVLTIGAFQAVAAGRAPAALLPLPPLLLLLDVGLLR